MGAAAGGGIGVLELWMVRVAVHRVAFCGGLKVLGLQYVGVAVCWGSRVGFRCVGPLHCLCYSYLQ